MHMNPAVPSIMDKCMTHVNYYTSAESQFSTLMRQWETPGMMGHPDDAWQNAWAVSYTHLEQLKEWFSSHMIQSRLSGSNTVFDFRESTTPVRLTHRNAQIPIRTGDSGAE